MLSKRLGRKRCCDATPDRCLECNRLTILTAHCENKCYVFFQYRGFWWDPRAWSVPNKKWIRPTSTLAPYKFTSKSEVFPTRAPLPNPKIKTSLSKVQALKFILQIAASKLENCVFPNSNLQILSSKSNLRSSFANLFNFKFSKTFWKSPKLYKGILAHFEKMSLARWFWAFFFFWKKKGVLPRKMG